MKPTLVGPVLLWAVLNVPVVLFVSGPALDTNRGREVLAGAVLTAVAVALRRTLPWASLALCTGLWWSLGLLHNDFGSLAVSARLPAVCVMGYSLGRAPVVPGAVLRGMGPVGAAGTVVGVLVGLTVPMWALLATGLIFAGLFPWLLGRYARQRYELQVAGWEHARQLELQQRGRVEQARLRERARIAQDMHDSLGHELNLIALRAAALQIAPDLGDRHRETAGELRAGVADAMARLGDIVGVLREDGTPVPMDPVHTDVASLVDRARASGALVELGLSGVVAELPPMADKAASRLVQESLTNVMKHAPGAKATVQLDHGPGDVTVTVRNGPSAQEVPSRRAGGRGLIGLGERIRLAGGEFRAAASADGGFEVVARLPRTPGPAAPARRNGSPGEGAGGGFVPVATSPLRRFAMVVGLPFALFACLLAVMLGHYAYGATTSVLPPSVYARLDIGASAAEAARLLPENEMSDPPSEHLLEPPGTRCRYYRARGDLFVTVDVYRLCFADGRLADKLEITAESRLPTDRG